MEVAYLLCSIISTILTSFVLSVLLPFRRASATMDAVSLYEGTVWHERRRPIHHSFLYPVRYALIDLDKAPRAPRDHLSAADARRVSNTNGPVFLLTIPPSVGYEQNPLSLYYCYDVDGTTRTLSKCIAEVTNTPWGERVTFLFDPDSDLVAKPLHVSPFMDMLANWRMKTSEPAENLRVLISVQHPKLGSYFTALLDAKRVVPPVDHSRFFWLMPHKVALWIYWHALKLWWKNVPLIQHPRYQNPGYKEDALVRNENIQPCPFSRNDNTVDNLNTRATDNRRFTWRDASWPWC